VVKAVLGRHFSLTVFGFAQVAMDVEPLVRMLRGDLIKHDLSHTYFGATAIGVFSLLVGRPVCQWLLGWWPTEGTHPFLGWLRGPRVISWTAATTGAFVGTSTHVLFDSVMHADMRPLAPFADENALLGLVSMEALHLLCVGAGVVGLVGLGGAYLLLGRLPRENGS
jgi:hypothetical protein